MRTHTVFFSTRLTSELDSLVVQIAADWSQRRKFIDAETRDRGDERLNALRAATFLAREWAD